MIPPPEGGFRPIQSRERSALVSEGAPTPQKGIRCRTEPDAVREGWTRGSTRVRGTRCERP